MLTGMLCKAVEADPVRAAIVQVNGRIRYDEFHALTGRCAAGLRRLGVRAGACVAVALPTCPEFVVALFARARRRAMMLPLDPRETGEELRRVTAEVRARVVIADPDRAGLFADAGATVAGF
jgi:long-chain acyl-CoA synthetase